MSSIRNLRFISSAVAVLACATIAKAATDEDAYTCVDDRQELCSMMPGDLPEIKKADEAVPTTSVSPLKSKLALNADLRGSSLSKSSLLSDDLALREVEEIQSGTGGPGGLLAVEQANKLREQIRQIEILLSSISRTGIDPGLVSATSKRK
jgi:hypothetical protein